LSFNAASIYRTNAARGVNLVNLVVQCYDQIIDDLRRAARAAEAGDIPKRVSELNHALAVLSHLQGALDFTQGGEVARSLDQFYRSNRAKMLEASALASAPMLQEVATHFASVREAWEKVDQETTGDAAVRAAASAPPVQRQGLAGYATGPGISSSAWTA
jgi:flagellar protein FliS